MQDTSAANTNGYVKVQYLFNLYSTIQSSQDTVADKELKVAGRFPRMFTNNSKLFEDRSVNN